MIIQKQINKIRIEYTEHTIVNNKKKNKFRDFQVTSTELKKNGVVKKKISNYLVNILYLSAKFTFGVTSCFFI